MYDATLSALVCDTPGALCDSTQYLVGRGAVGPEANAPNTLGSSCPDGDLGAFHAEASVDAIRVSHPTKAVLSEQKAVKVEADVWGLSSGGSTVMFFQAADARNPQWVHVTTLSATGEAQTLSTTYTLPAGGMQAVRVAIVDAAAYSPSYSCSWSTRGSPNGPFRVRAEAYDTAGNQTLSAWVRHLRLLPL